MKETTYTFGSVKVKVIEKQDDKRQERLEKACQRFFREVERSKTKNG